MNDPGFTTLVQTAKISARPDGLWTLAIPWVSDVSVLRITAAPNQVWRFGQSGESCGPAGLLKRDLRALVAWAPVGALIGKVGGSDTEDTSALPLSAEITMPIAPAMTLFTVGRFCTVDIKDKQGPLFLTMNDAVANFAVHAGEIEVTIEGVPHFQTK